ncbi:MAG: VOC family protein [Deltaproteobacteria bacterium]|nr:VOC family protein [Deltaproteobacteria bacterium]
MIDHTGFAVTDLARSIEFYNKALAPLGMGLIMKFQEIAAGFGENGKPEFWIHGGHTPTDQIHIAFRAKGRAEVKAFYEAALAAGGTDNGPPGERPQYHESYYGAFVKDLDGHNIEAVCHEAYLG